MLVMPHSNAELKRLFSIVRKNKTLEHSSLKLDGTLSSILAVKTMYPSRSIKKRLLQRQSVKTKHSLRLKISVGRLF